MAALPPRIMLCPGQGAQAVGMGRAWFEKSAEARAVFAAADRVIGERLGARVTLSQLCFEGPAERLNQTDAAQPALYVCAVASWAGLLASWGAGGGVGNGGAVLGSGVQEAEVLAAAGLSLGEYSALHIAGCFTFEDGLELVALRGRAMQDAATAVASGMVALIGADEAQAAAVCEAAREGEVLVPANFNAPGQIVISGSKGACGRAVEAAGKIGLRATPLAVAGAFHSPLMAPAAERLRSALSRVTIHAPRCPVISNVTARAHEHSPETIRARLVEQLTEPVRWEQGCRTLGQLRGNNDAVQWHELAPGKTLAGLMRRIDKTVKVETHDEPSDQPSP